MDWMITAGIAVVGILLLFKLAYYTVKRVLTHLVLGYATVLVLEYVFQRTVVMDTLMWVLTALFGPVAPIVAFLWQML